MNLRKILALTFCMCLIMSLIVSAGSPITVKAILPYSPTDFRLYGYSNPLNLTSRVTIYNYIETNPGIHLRQICNDLDISIGSAQYHLNRLVDGELLESEKESKYRRFFVSRRFSDFEKTLLSYLNKPTSRSIIRLVMGKDGVNHRELAEKIGISSQAVTWQVQRLVENGLIISKNDEKCTRYYSSEKMKEYYPTLL